MNDRAKPTVTYAQVSRDEEGCRLDNFLMGRCKGVPKQRLYKAIRKGEVRVNKKRANAFQRLEAGDEIRIPPLELAERPILKINDQLTQILKEAILYEDEHMWVINKPAGLAVHSGSGVKLGVVEAFRLMFPNYPKLDLAHRLDQQTSGCLILAKNRQSTVALHKAFREGTIQKHYIALVSGHWPKSLQKLTWPLKKLEMPSGDRRVIVDDEGKPSETRVKPIAYTEDATLIDVLLKTGRTHQIRAHTAYAKHPIVNDEKYGKRTVNQAFKAKGLTEMCLHAHVLEIECKELDLSLRIEAPLPEYMRAIASS